MMQNQTIANNAQHHGVMQHIGGLSQSNSISQQQQQTVRNAENQLLIIILKSFFFSLN